MWKWKDGPRTGRTGFRLFFRRDSLSGTETRLLCTYQNISYFRGCPDRVSPVACMSFHSTLLLLVCCVQFSAQHTSAHGHMLKLVRTFALLAPVSGFVAPLCWNLPTPRGFVATVNKATNEAPSAAGPWALIFDCDGVILEV